MLDDKFHIRINRFIQDMPPLSISVSKIVELSKNPKVDAKMLNDIISVDPVLTGKVLKLINSAYYSLPNKVTSLIRAIVMLGINTIKNLVISTGVVSAMKQKYTTTALDLESFWRHSLGVGVMAKYFAQKQNIDPKLIEEFFVAGLLHDIGKIPFNSVIADTYLEVIQYSKMKSLPICEVETRFLEINHSELGLRIANLWKLPSTLRESIAHHHTFSEVSTEQQKLVATVCLANNTTNRIWPGAGGDHGVYDNQDILLKITGLNQNDLEDAEKDADATVKKAEIFLKL